MCKLYRPLTIRMKTIVVCLSLIPDDIDDIKFLCTLTIPFVGKDLFNLPNFWKLLLSFYVSFNLYIRNVTNILLPIQIS